MNTSNESSTSLKSPSIQSLLTHPTAICFFASLSLIVTNLFSGDFGCLALPVFIFYSIAYVRSKSKENPDTNLTIPIVLLIAATMIVVFVPFMDIRAEIKFRLNQPEYERLVKQIAEDIRNGKIETLPITYEYQSNSIKYITVFHQRNLHGYVIIFTNDSSISQSAGLLYLSPDCNIEVLECVSEPYSSFETIRYLEPDWYIFRVWILE